MECKIKNVFCENKKIVIVIALIVTFVAGLVSARNLFFPKRFDRVENGQLNDFRDLTPEERAEKMEELKASGKIPEGRRPMDGRGANRK